MLVLVSDEGTMSAAEQMLRHFVLTHRQMYGVQEMTMNAHLLMHLADTRTHVPLTPGKKKHKRKDRHLRLSETPFSGTMEQPKNELRVELRRGEILLFEVIHSFECTPRQGY
ncbi:hypothetical protein FGIG_11266 [Fasciola gigantica]|uniref:Uncharacterized protein n=1 Tax=Fasciola gigantica TaxID=46835 RepID=A0A504Y4H0_FASGI|nr:hypothetical protein FGIG_11266 [Fasciola gigantica]